MKNIDEIIDSLRSTYGKFPIEYEQTLKKVVRLAIKIFKNNLYNITLGGSGGKGNIIEGWSDLDIYIILGEYDTNSIVNFMKTVCNDKIHVGTTFYTLNEIKYNLIDRKTKVMCYEKQEYFVNPTIYGEEVFELIEYEKIVESDMRNFPNILHDFRRIYIELISEKENKVTKTYIKKMLVLIKCLLSYFNVFSYGYKESFDILKNIFKKYGCELTPIMTFDIIGTINNINNSKEDVVQFSNYLLNFIEHNYILEEREKEWKKELVREQ